MSALLRSLITGAADLVWPRVCLLCDARLDPVACATGLCERCHTELTADVADVCPRCASTVGPHTDLAAGCPRCKASVYRFSGSVRLGSYDGRLREAVLRLKDESGEPLAEELGGLLAGKRAAHFAERPATVVPVPLYWRKRWVRGYNQAEAVARGVAARLGVPVRAGWLVRTRPTPNQPSRSPAERWENVRGAFRVPRGVRLPNVPVVLVDDVLTTGATADAAAVALRAAGVAQVTVAVLAHR